MCVLTGAEIEKRANDIFSRKSWAPHCFQEASYDLRVDTEPVLRIGGILFEDSSPYQSERLKIMPGEMALLPTIESFDMPADLVGSIKIKFSHSRKGLTPLFGPKVDPYFGRGHDRERLYLWVSNLGLTPIRLKRGDRVFTVQFHKLYGEPRKFEPKPSIRDIVAREAYEMGIEQSLGFIDSVKKDVWEEFGSRLIRAEEGTERVVVFGLFLVASALLAGAITTLFLLEPNLEIASEVDSLEKLMGNPLLLLIYWVCVVLAVTVTVLCLGAVFQLLRSPMKLAANLFKGLVRCVCRW